MTVQKKSFKVGESVVVCSSERLCKNRGASGVVISCETGGKKKKVRAVFVRWVAHRKGVSCFRIRGKGRAKNDSLKETGWADPSIPIGHLRYEESIDNLCSLDKCRTCRYRLTRLFRKCPPILLGRLRPWDKKSWWDQKSNKQKDADARNMLAQFLSVGH
jgi:hypothetical protein